MSLTKKFKSIPAILVAFLVFDALALGAFGSYYLAQRSFANKMAKIEAQNPENLVKNATAKVLPAEGYTTSLSWGDLGQKLIASGAIDWDQYGEYFSGLDIFSGPSNQKIAINEQNSRALVNTLWALGLTQKSKVLDEGPMKTSGNDPANFASTGGWTLGKKPTMELYSSQELIPLTAVQQELVTKIAENVYRPCCGNSVAFPDCNHGMAALGYIELAVASGLPEEQIYKDLLAFNSFWFPQTYVEMAIYFKQNQNLDWDQVDAKTALSYEYSSASGASRISKEVQNVPGLESQGGSCGA